jgi:hypothetical protein
MPSPSKPAISLDDLVRAGKMQTLRATAIEQYSKMEASLAQLLAHLADTPDMAASIIYFQMVNTRARTKALEQLLQMKHGTQYDVHWHGRPGSPGKPKQPGLFALIRQTDEQRNNIVHWRTMEYISSGVKQDDRLVMPDFWYRAPGKPPEPITTTVLEEFILKTEFILRSINMFTWFHDGRRGVTPEVRQTWLEIFQQPGLYPPLDTHPLSPNYVAPETPLQSSGA